MRRYYPRIKKTLDLTIQIVRERLIESADIGNFDAAKKEIDLLQGLLKLANLDEKSDAQTISKRRAERDKLMEELNRKLARINKSS
jgi:hypothetical protein